MTFKETLDQTNEETTLSRRQQCVCGDGLQIINQNSALSQSIIVINLENSLFTYFSDSGVQMK